MTAPLEVGTLAWLALATTALAIGPILERTSRAHPRIREALDGFFGGLISALVSLHVIPGAAEVLGPFAWLLAGLGLLAPIVALLPSAFGSVRGTGGAFAASRRCRRSERKKLPASLTEQGQETGAARADKKGPMAFRRVLGFVVVGLGLHALLDGAALAVSTPQTLSHQAALALAVVVHRLPVGLLIWGHAGGRGSAASALIVITGMTALGAILGPKISLLDASVPLAAFQAMVGGSLVHILLEMSPLSPGTVSKRVTTLWVGSAGFLLGASLTLTLPHHPHHGGPEVIGWFALVGCALLRKRGPREVVQRFWRGP